MITGTGLQVLYEAVGLFDRDLSEFAVLVEHVEEIAFSNFLGWEVACVKFLVSPLYLLSRQLISLCTDKKP